jgi:hypothetical protein
MKLWGLFLGLFAAVAGASASQSSAKLDQLKVLYIGDPDTPRATQFSDFLQPKVAKVKVVAREGFKAAQADDFDVVLLDWPQSNSTREDWKRGRSPLGDRDAWTKPTVLLGSAGLNLAVVWKVRGGSG